MRLIQATDTELKREVLRAAREAGRIVGRIPGENIGAVIRRAQYNQSREALLAIASDLWTGIQASIESGAASATSLVTQQNKDILAMLLRAMPEEAAALAETFSASSFQTLESIRSRFLNSIDLSPSVYRNSALMSGKIDAIVNDGIALGKSAREIAADVRGYINPRVQGGVRYAAMRLGRTELNNAFHTTSVRQYQESSWVEGVRWNLSGSHPRRDDCNDFAERNDFDLGRGVYPSTQVPFKPHPQCFCFTTAITPEPEEFVDRLLAGVPV